MRKIILNLAVSLDGYIEGPHGEFDWCFTDQDYGMKAFYNSIDALFIGRKSYELAETMKYNPYSGKKMYIFSTTKTNCKEDEVLIAGEIKEQVETLKRKPGKDIWLFGGASLVSSFIQLNLIDEFMLSVHPVILGKGKPLFSNIKQRLELKLKDVKTYSTGLVQLFYTA